MQRNRHERLSGRPGFRWIAGAVSSILFSGAAALAGFAPAAMSTGHSNQPAFLASHGNPRNTLAGAPTTASASLAAILASAHGEAWNAQVPKLASWHESNARGEAWNTEVAVLVSWHAGALGGRPLAGEAWN